MGLESVRFTGIYRITLAITLHKIVNFVLFPKSRFVYFFLYGSLGLFFSLMKNHLIHWNLIFVELHCPIYIIANSWACYY